MNTNFISSISVKPVNESAITVSSCSREINRNVSFDDIPESQRWFFTDEWLSVEEEVTRDYEAGNYETFSNAEDFLKDLFD